MKNFPGTRETRKVWRGETFCSFVSRIFLTQGRRRYCMRGKHCPHIHDGSSSFYQSALKGCFLCNFSTRKGGIYRIPKWLKKGLNCEFRTVPWGTDMLIQNGVRLFPLYQLVHQSMHLHFQNAGNRALKTKQKKHACCDESYDPLTAIRFQTIQE